MFHHTSRMRYSNNVAVDSLVFRVLTDCVEFSGYLPDLPKVGIKQVLAATAIIGDTLILGIQSRDLSLDFFLIAEVS